MHRNTLSSTRKLHLFVRHGCISPTDGGFAIETAPQTDNGATFQYVLPVSVDIADAKHCMPLSLVVQSSSYFSERKHPPYFPSRAMQCRPLKPIGFTRSQELQLQDNVNLTPFGAADVSGSPCIVIIDAAKSCFPSLVVPCCKIK